MSDSFWKQRNVWWVPIVSLILGGVGWIIKNQFELSHQLATIVGRVPPPPTKVSIYIDGHKIAETSETGWYRVNQIPPGNHEIGWRGEGFGAKSAMVEIKGGKQNKVDLTSLLPAVEAKTSVPQRVFDVVSVTEVHRWFAGTKYSGDIDMNPEYPFVWRCSGGTCILEGPYGKGLNMEVCRRLSREVGPLEYYYNDAGMRWSKTENSSLLDQCNRNP